MKQSTRSITQHSCKLTIPNRRKPNTHTHPKRKPHRRIRNIRTKLNILKRHVALRSCAKSHAGPSWTHKLRGLNMLWDGQSPRGHVYVNGTHVDVYFCDIRCNLTGAGPINHRSERLPAP